VKEMTDDEEFDLAVSKEKVGALVPILKDKYGNTIDGIHRLKVDKEWPSITLEHIQDPVQLAVARLVANLHRRNIRDEEVQELLGEIKRLTGWKVPQIADVIGMSPRWVWKYLPDESKDKTKADARRASKGAFKVELYNVWSFSKCDTRFGKPNFPARVPGQIVTQLLYYYTNEGELVVDPMAGSGTTYDACQYMKRKCLSYDITPIRDFIKPHDIRNGFPQETHGCDLIFLDPPYWKMKREDFGFDSVSNNPLNEFLSFLEKLAKDSYETVKTFGAVAILMQDMTEKHRLSLSGETYSIFKKVGFSCFDHISCPLSTQEFLPQQVERAKKEKTILGRNRDLYVFRKS
jgi:hypothetical protein